MIPFSEKFQKRQIYKKLYEWLLKDWRGESWGEMGNNREWVSFDLMKMF